MNYSRGHANRTRKTNRPSPTTFYIKCSKLIYLSYFRIFDDDGNNDISIKRKRCQIRRHVGNINKCFRICMYVCTRVLSRLGVAATLVIIMTAMRIFIFTFSCKVCIQVFISLFMYCCQLTYFAQKSGKFRDYIINFIQRNLARVSEISPQTFQLIVFLIVA